MLSLQEITGKYDKELRETRRIMDATATFHPSQVYTAHQHMEVSDTLNAIPWSRLKEFLGKGQALGDYFVATKVHDTLMYYSKPTDIVPLISAQVLYGWEGGDLDVPIGDDSSYKADWFGDGGLPTQTVGTMKPTISPVGFGIKPAITGDLIDDAQFGIVEWHLRNAAKGIGDFASDLALTVLQTATDGWGTVNSSATGDADETLFTGGTTADVLDAVRANGNDDFITDTMVTTPESWAHSISTNAAEIGWATVAGAGGYNFKLGNIDVLLSTSGTLHASTDAAGAAMTNCITLLFSRGDALLTGRKAWMQLTNYANPVKDLDGLVIKCRQDSVSLYDDSIYKLTET
jgi:hypothetical protein